MKQQESHLDTTDEIMRRAAAILNSLTERSHRQQIKGAHTCPLGTAKFQCRSKVRNGMYDSDNAEAEVLKITEEDWSFITRQIAQALFLFYGSTQFGRVATNEVISLNARTSSDTARSHTVKSLTSLYIIESIHAEFLQDIFCAAVQWLGTLAIIGRLPKNEVMEDEESRFQFWEAQIDDTGRLIDYNPFMP